MEAVGGPADAINQVYDLLLGKCAEVHEKMQQMVVVKKRLDPSFDKSLPGLDELA